MKLKAAAIKEVEHAFDFLDRKNAEFAEQCDEDSREHQRQMTEVVRNMHVDIVRVLRGQEPLNYPVAE